MSGELTDTAELNILKWLTNNTPTAPTFPLKLALVTSASSDSAAGTEVTGGSYARQTLAMSSAQPSLNSADITFSGMPACTVTGVEIWDSAGSPVRWAYKSVTSKTVNAGDDVKVTAGNLSLDID